MVYHCLAWIAGVSKEVRFCSLHTYRFKQLLYKKLFVLMKAVQLSIVAKDVINNKVFQLWQYLFKECLDGTVNSLVFTKYLNDWAGSRCFLIAEIRISCSWFRNCFRSLERQMLGSFFLPRGVRLDTDAVTVSNHLLVFVKSNRYCYKHNCFGDYKKVAKVGKFTEQLLLLLTI